MPLTHEIQDTAGFGVAKPVTAALVCGTVAAWVTTVSPNLLRHLMDGLTFAIGFTVALSVFEPGLLLVVASNVVYATVTAGACILGPTINLAERYGDLIDK